MRLLFRLPAWFLIFVSLALIVVLGYDSWQKSEFYYEKRLQMIANAPNHAGEQLCIGFVRVTNIEGDAITAVDRNAYYYFFKAETKNINKGDIYSFSGVLNKDGTITTDAVTPHPHRKLKYLFSAASIFIVLFLVIRHIRWDNDKHGFMDMSLPPLSDKGGRRSA